MQPDAYIKQYMCFARFIKAEEEGEGDGKTGLHKRE